MSFRAAVSLLSAAPRPAAVSLLSAARRPAAGLRALHGSAPRRSARLLTAEEVFGRRSMQDYLKKLEREYEESLQKANSSESGGGPEEEQRLRATRTTVHRMAPLVQSLRELEANEAELREAEALLTGEAPCLTLTLTLTISNLNPN